MPSLKKEIAQYFLVTALCFFSQKVFSQNKADSIRNVLKSSAEDTNKVNSLLALYFEVQYSQPDEALQNARKAFSLSEKLSFKRGEATGSRLIGLSLFYKADYDSSRIYYDKSLNLCEQIGDSIGKAKIYLNLGSIENTQGRLRQALEFNQKSLTILENAGEKTIRAKAYNNIGIIHEALKNYDKALEYLFKSFDLKNEIGDKQSICNTLDNIALVYHEQKKFSNEYKYHLKSFEIRKLTGDKQGLADSYRNLGKDFERLDKLDSALLYFSEGLKMNIKTGNKNGIGELSAALGKLYLKKNNFDDALTNLEKGLVIGKEINHKDMMRDCYEGLASVYKKQNNFKKALEYTEQSVVLKDILLDEDKNKLLLEMEGKYEFEKKEKEITILNKDNEISRQTANRQRLIKNYFIGGFGVVLLFSLIVYKQKNRINKEKKRSEELLLNILPSETAEELKQTGSAKARSYEMVTVMFTDFKNFTRASETLSPEELVEEINYCYSAFDKIISDHHIEKIKTIGDSYMCAGGLPVANQSNAKDVVNAALEICEFMLKRKSEINNPQFEIRIGVHTGPVVAGIVGIKKFAYDIWGDTVNIASRMESSGEAGKVNISGATYEFVKNDFTCFHRGKIDAKNKGEVDMYFVEAKK